MNTKESNVGHFVIYRNGVIFNTSDTVSKALIKNFVRKQNFFSRISLNLIISVFSKVD